MELAQTGAERGWGRSWAGLGVALAASLLVAGLAVATSSFAPNPVAAPADARSVSAGSGLAVSPVNWSLTAGGTVDLHAYLVPASDGCIPVDAVFTWQLAGAGGALGYLNASSGANERFFAFDYAVGFATVQLSAVGVAECDGLSTFTASTTAAVRIYPALAASSLVVSTDPVPTGSPESLALTVGGGLAPYSLVAEFGDGGSASLELDVAGTASLVHTYPDGTFLPSVVVIDSLGDRAVVGPERPITVAPRLAVAILTPSSEVDTGRPFEVAASVVGGVGTVTEAWVASDGEVGAGPLWAVNLSAPGPANVSLRVTDSDGEVASAVLPVEAAAPLAAQVLDAPRSVDLGDPIPFNLSLTGGVAPFEVVASLLPSGSEFAASGLDARAFPAALEAAGLGPAWVELAAVDALGARLAEAVPVSEVVAAPTLAVLGGSGPAEVGSVIELVGEVGGGLPPFDWSVRPSGPLGNSTPLSGSLGARGPFAVTGTLETAGPLAALVAVRDATGAEVEQNLSVEVAPALNAGLSLGRSNVSVGSPVPLVLRAEGGVPPYRAALELSDGELFEANLSEPGALAWGAHPNLTGPLAVRASLTDRDAATWSENLTLEVGPPGSPPLLLPPVPPPVPPGAGASESGWAWGPFAAGFGSAAVGAVFLAVLWVRGGARAARTPASPPATREELAVVRRVLRENDGVDTATLELLAEDDGVGRDRTEVALRSWDRLGLVTREQEEGAPDLLRWQDRSASSAPDLDEGGPAPSGEDR